MIITFEQKYAFLQLFVLIAVVNSVAEGKPLVTTKRVSRSTVSGEVWNNKKLFLWENGEIPFIVDSSLANKRSFINKAFNYFHQHTCIRFVPKNIEHEHYINITGKENLGCRSDIGRQLFEQHVHLSHDYCFLGANILHELLHTMGFVHEHTRPDRDKYVDMDYKKITKLDSYYNDAKVRQNFDKNETAVTLSPYDYVSVMHYGPKWVKTVKKAGAVIFDVENNGYGLSELDLKHLNKLYNCSMAENA